MSVFNLTPTLNLVFGLLLISLCLCGTNWYAAYLDLFKHLLVLVTGQCISTGCYELGSYNEDSEFEGISSMKSFSELFYYQTPFIFRGEEMCTQCLCVYKNMTQALIWSQVSQSRQMDKTQVFGLYMILLATSFQLTLKVWPIQVCFDKWLSGDRTYASLQRQCTLLHEKNMEFTT